MRTRGDGESLVLCYHALSQGWPAATAVTPRSFEAQMSILARRGYRGVTLSEGARARRGEGVVAVTFDDAFRSVYERAFPVLARLGWPATLFVPTAFVGGGRLLDWPGLDSWVGGAHEGELAAMTWDEVAALARAGWEIGSHTVMHPHLTSLDDESLARELRDSKRACEEVLAAPCLSLAYPYGDADARVAEAARKAGYELGCTIRPREPRSPLLRSRIGIWRQDGDVVFRLKLSRGGERLRASDSWRRVASSGRWLRRHVSPRS